MQTRKVAQEVYWVGARNPDLRAFHIEIPVKGTSYNSYLIRGTEHTAVVDGVREKYAPEQCARIAAVCDLAKIDYIIVQNAEPDHSGSLAKLVQMAPQAQVVCTQEAWRLCAGGLTIEPRRREVKAGDTLSLGGKTLRFFPAQQVCWPGTMLTYLEEDGILFSGDLFGVHTGQQEADDTDAQTRYLEEMFRPYRRGLAAFLPEVEKMSPKTLAPGHGPVFGGAQVGQTISRYQSFCRRDADSARARVYIAYLSCYGNTERLAEGLYEGCVYAGVDAEMDDIGQVGAAYAAEKLLAADAVAIGCPTLHRDAPRLMWETLAPLTQEEMSAKAAVVFGSCGWSGEAAVYLEERLRHVGALLGERLEVRTAPGASDEREAKRLGKWLAACAKARKGE